MKAYMDPPLVFAEIRHMLPGESEKRFKDFCYRYNLTYSEGLEEVLRRVKYYPLEVHLAGRLLD